MGEANLFMDDEVQRGLTGDDERDWGMVAAAMAEIGEPSSAVNYYSSPGPKDGMGREKEGKRGRVNTYFYH